MNFDWLKRYTPRSLYARAALILLVPILAIQLVVTVVFIQRLYNDVTEQMTENLAVDLRFVLDVVQDAPDAASARRSLDDLQSSFELHAILPASGNGRDRRYWYDLSGRAVTSVLRAEFPEISAVNLSSSSNRVFVTVATPHGPLELDFPRRRVSASNPHQLLVLMALTSILMTVIAFAYLRNQLRPVKLLARAAEAFGRGRVVPFRPRGATEMRAAGRAFLDMRTRLERMIEQRTMMLSGVSHDLRTPLTRLRLALSLQDETPETTAMQRDLDDMERLVDTFLDFARGDALEERALIDPAELVRDLRDRWREGGHDVEIVAAKDTPLMTVSPIALSRALENIVGNAVRYGTRTRIGVESGPRTVRFVVEDNGPGIPVEHREEALKPFSRLDIARNQDRGPGVGLGLAIANDIARRHGGNLTLGDSKEMGGLRAEIVLPN